MKISFIIYCDFEALLKTIKTWNINPDTNNLTQQELCSFGYYIKNVSLMIVTVTYGGVDCGTVFTKYLKEDFKKIITTLTIKIDMKNLTIAQ